MSQNIDTDEKMLIDLVSLGNDCEAFRSSRLWKVLMERKAFWSQSLIFGSHTADQLLVIRAKLDELRWFEHAVRNGTEEKAQAEAALMEM